MAQFELIGVWGSARLAGTSCESVNAYVGRLADHGINAVFMGLKQGDGSLCWPSPGFPEAVHPEYRSFDLPYELLRAGEKHGMAIHAWLIDYYEGEHGAANRLHPEWAALSSRGQSTAEENLRGRRFGAVWMCPAQRPGYTDQWLVPLYREFAERYPVASLHHDYIRYCGDLAPDLTCFCDSCLDSMVEYGEFVPEPYADEPFELDLTDRPYLEAHWEPSARALPVNWISMSREAKAAHLLEGGFFAEGRRDMDFFFYQHRMEQIDRFARESALAVRSANPAIKLSAAVFKNPVHSGRFIGQDWRRFGSDVDLMIPMNYRSHFLGSHEQYCGLLERIVARQLEWNRSAEYACGISLHDLYPDTRGVGGPFPESRLLEACEAAGRGGAKGLVCFCDGHLDDYSLWGAVKRLG